MVLLSLLLFIAFHC